MKKYISLVIVLCFWSAVSLAQKPIIPHIQHHKIEATFSIQKHTLEATDRILIQNTPGLSKVVLFLNRNLRVTAVQVEGQTALYRTIPEFSVESVLHKIRKDTRDFYSNAQLLEIPLPPHLLGVFRVKITYTGKIYDPPHVPAYSRDAAAVETRGVIGEKGVFLGPESHWFPEAESSLASHEVITHTPEGWETVTQGERLVHKTDGNMLTVHWKNEHPADGLYLIAGKYNVRELAAGPVTIYTYFFPEDSSLAQKYLSFSARYVKMYSRLLSPYPYKKFAVVENFFPTGYGMPSYTVLGQTVLRLPFIVYTSLGHEILHNWWGNSVFVDYDSGNWCEGLTMYMADYYYKELQGPAQARAYRYGIDRDYTLYVNDKNDFPLDKFLNRTAMYTRMIGYGKSGMVFHMLRRWMGDEKFYQALRNFIRDKQFQKASWSDLQKEFEAVSGLDLSTYFDQWVHRTGAPRLVLEKVTRHKSWRRGWTVTGTLFQKERVFALRIPVQVYFKSDTLDTVLVTSRAETPIDFQFKKKPLKLAVDPGYNLMRRLNHGEMSPVLSLILGDENAVMVLPSRAAPGMAKAYQLLAHQLTGSGDGMIKWDTDVSNADLASGSVFLFGGPEENALYGKALAALKGKLAFSKNGISLAGKSYANKSVVAAFWSPWNPAKGLCLFRAASPDVVRTLGMKIMHYGKYGYLVFDGTKAVAKGGWPVVNNPLVVNLK
ncbi:MAG: M1 family metallopeptidase [Calditrichaeota bacterium]|nr:M1 family metallopeptidase [Calditrichota bacterium]